MKIFKNRKGFTLTELMVVVVILGILVAIAIPVYNNLDTRAKDSANEANIRTIKSVVLQFCMDENIAQSTLKITPTFAADGKSVSSLTIVDDTTTLTRTDLNEYIDEWPMSPYKDKDESYEYNGGTVDLYTKPAG